MSTIDVDGLIEARQAQIDALERQLKDLAMDQISAAMDEFLRFEERVGRLKRCLEELEAG